MAGIFLDSSNQVQYADSINVKIVYQKDKTSSSSANVFFDSQQFELSCNHLEYNIQGSAAILKQCRSLAKLLESKTEQVNTITIEVANEKLFYAFGTVIRFLHMQPVLKKNVSIEQMRYLLRPNTGIDAELCIACKKLELPSFERHFEEFFISGLTVNSFIQTCQYASTYSSKAVLNACYAFIKREGVVCSDEDPSTFQYTGDILFNEEKRRFYYQSKHVSADIFNTLLSNDLIVRSKYLAPGYLSSGGIPCKYDSMTEEEFRKIGKKKKNMGFEGTIRCYVEKITDGDSFIYRMVREDTNEFLLSAVMIPEENTVAFFNTSTVNHSNVIQHLYTEDYIGLMTSNAMGTEFIVYDNGVDPDLVPAVVFDDIHQKTVCKVTYENNIAGRKPNVMEIDLPATNKEILDCISQDGKDRKKEFIAMRSTSAVKLVTKKPQWSEELKGYTLKFNGRAKKASKRNFQLVYREDENDPKAKVLVSFGKLSSLKYTVDYAPPLSSMQAFAIAVTRFMKKLLVA